MRRYWFHWLENRSPPSCHLHSSVGTHGIYILIELTLHNYSLLLCIKNLPQKKFYVQWAKWANVLAAVGLLCQISYDAAFSQICEFASLY